MRRVRVLNGGAFFLWVVCVREYTERHLRAACVRAPAWIYFFYGRVWDDFNGVDG